MNFSLSRTSAEWARRWYPAFSRRATQVCILSAALEKIAFGASDAQGIARAALEQANPFGWNERVATDPLAPDLLEGRAKPVKPARARKEAKEPAHRVPAAKQSTKRKEK